MAAHLVLVKRQGLGRRYFDRLEGGDRIRAHPLARDAEMEESLQAFLFLGTWKSDCRSSAAKLCDLVDAELFQRIEAARLAPRKELLPQQTFCLPIVASDSPRLLMSSKNRSTAAGMSGMSRDDDANLARGLPTAHPVLGGLPRARSRLRRRYSPPSDP